MFICSTHNYTCQPPAIAEHREINQNDSNHFLFLYEPQLTNAYVLWACGNIVLQKEKTFGGMMTPYHVTGIKND